MRVTWINPPSTSPCRVDSGRPRREDRPPQAWGRGTARAPRSIRGALGGKRGQTRGSRDSNGRQVARTWSRKPCARAQPDCRKGRREWRLQRNDQHKRRCGNERGPKDGCIRSLRCVCRFRRLVLLAGMKAARMRGLAAPAPRSDGIGLQKTADCHIICCVRGCPHDGRCSCVTSGKTAAF